MVVFGQKWLYLGKSGCFNAKVVVFGQSGSIRSKKLYSGKSSCNRLFDGIREKVFVFGQKWLYSGKDVVFG